MPDQGPTELMILMRIVEVLERRMLRDDRTMNEDPMAGHIANVVNNFIASSPNLAFTGSSEALVMGDNYTTGQAAAVGPNSSVQEASFVQIWNQVGSGIDLPNLSGQLAQVRAEMRRLARGDPEQDVSVAEVAQAEISAKSDDGPSVIKHLGKAGLWALDVAKSIGTEIAAAAIKAALGLPQ